MYTPPVMRNFTFNEQGYRVDTVDRRREYRERAEAAGVLTPERIERGQMVRRLLNLPIEWIRPWQF